MRLAIDLPWGGINADGAVYDSIKHGDGILGLGLNRLTAAEEMALVTKDLKGACRIFHERFGEKIRQVCDGLRLVPQDEETAILNKGPKSLLATLENMLTSIDAENPAKFFHLGRYAASEPSGNGSVLDWMESLAHYRPCAFFSPLQAFQTAAEWQEQAPERSPKIAAAYALLSQDLIPAWKHEGLLRNLGQLVAKAAFIKQKGRLPSTYPDMVVCELRENQPCQYGIHDWLPL